ncbi:hypothetical protein NA56DRAFT_695965 [Hyaloscypha hepaticicola]|uniref:Uncharacterized protein n=1 Tax=Hyaloscypha hepaticicola TaxID=2082293 RepID=A0A2J6QPM4_9HELO|nr:hypothetical protein NA56DRAFT_695965 [Hyaloscypha hepaticicola]
MADRIVGIVLIRSDIMQAHSERYFRTGPKNNHVRIKKLLNGGIAVLRNPTIRVYLRERSSACTSQRMTALLPKAHSHSSEGGQRGRLDHTCIMVPESGRLSKRGESRNVTRGREGERFNSLLCVCRLAEKSVVRNRRNKRVNRLVGAWFRGGGHLRPLIGRWTRRMKRPYSVSTCSLRLLAYCFSYVVLVDEGMLVAADGHCVKVGASPNPYR